jgi:hypothetical protein
MRQFWSMRPNKRRQIAQTLRFEWPAKPRIIEAAPTIELVFPTFSRRLNASRQAQYPRSGDKFCIQDLAAPIAAKRESFMAETILKLRLNQQQLELMDRTIAQGVAPDRVSLVRLALREYVAARQAETAR